MTQLSLVYLQEQVSEQKQNAEGLRRNKLG
jgi:hypothetical protein